MADTAEAPAVLRRPTPASPPDPPVALPAPALPPPAFLIDSAETGRLCGIGKTCLYRLLATEAFGPRPLRLGRAVRFSRVEIERWIDAGCPPRARWEAMRGGRR